MNTRDNENSFDRTFSGYRIFDAHFHFTCRQDVFNYIQSIGVELNDWLISIRTRYPEAELPPDDPQKIGLHWLQEMEKVGIDYMTFIPREGSERVVWQAAQVDPSRLLNFVRINPVQDDVLEKLEFACREFQIKGVKTVPPAMKYHFYDERAYPVYEFIQEKKIPILTHMGIYGARHMTDMRYANPLDIQPIARDFPEIPIIIPHFGAGFLREVLLLGYQCPNVFVDNSGKGTWLQHSPEDLNLEKVFSRVIGAMGVNRVLYGTDGGTFSLKYRVELLTETIKTLEALKLSSEEIQMILFDNTQSIFTKKW